MNLYEHMRKLKGESILEIGCGEGYNLRRLQGNFKKLVGVDAFQPVLDKGKGDGIKRICYDLRSGLENLFEKNSFDVIIGIDIIEHFEKLDAYKLLAECEAVAKSEIFLFVPIGDHPQDKDDRGLGNDFYQTHRSTWDIETLKTLGYEILEYDKDYHGKNKGACICRKLLSTP